MPDINRATLPEEFFDVTSAGLLIEPEPQYLHAALLKMSLAASLDVGSMLGLMVPGREFGTKGAPYADAEAGRLLLSPDGLYDQTVHVVTELGKTPGHTVRLNRPSYTNTTYTFASREVGQNVTIATTPTTVDSDQIPVTLKRYAGPLDPVTGAVAPYGVDRFDGSVMLHRPAMIVGHNLKRDFDRTLDTFGVTLLDSGASIVRPAGFAADDDHAVAGDGPMSYAVMLSAERTLDDLNVPTFANGKRVMVLHPRQAEQLSSDAQFNRLAVFQQDFNPLFRGTYWRSVGQWDLFKSTRLTSVNNSSGVQVFRGQAFAPGAIGAGIGEMPRTAYNTQDNYGERALVIWLLYAGFATLDNRFIASIRTS